MYPQRSIIFTNAVKDSNIVGLLEADSIPIVVSNQAVLDYGPKSSIKKYPRAPTAIQVNIWLFIAVYNKIFNSYSLNIISTDNRKYRCGLSLIIHHTVRH